MSDAQHGLSAPIARGNVLHSPASLGDLAHRTANTQRFGIEPEIAFTLGQALPPLGDGQSYRRGQVIAAVASAHSAVEICVARLSDFNAAPPLERLADSIMNEGLVLGPGVARWQQLDMAKRGLMLQIGGRIAHQGVGGHPLDDPLLPLVWLANHLSARAVGLQAGDVVTTGSCAGIHWAEAGSLASAEFEGLGGVVLNC